MGWVDQLERATVALDAAPLIYYIEEHPRYLPIVEPFFDALDRGTFQAVASTVALLEVLVYPLRQHDDQLAEAYRTILVGSDVLTLISPSAEIAERAARLRAHYSIKTPDALHLATAQHIRAGYFVTNDARLPTVPGIEIISLHRLFGHDQT